jgi:AraC-like DNA-binding protein
MYWIDLFHFLILAINIGFGFFFLFGPHYNPFQSRLLGFFFILSNVRFLNFLLLKYHLSAFAPHFYMIGGILMFFTPPILWFYLLSILDRKNRFERSDWLHFVPGVFLTIWLLPNFFLPESEILGQMKVIEEMESAKVFFITLTEQGPNIQFAISIVIFYLIYLGMYWKKIIPFLSPKAEKIFEPATRFWLIWVFAGYSIVFILTLLLTLLNRKWVSGLTLELGIELVYCLRTIMVLVMVVLLLKNRELMFGVVTVDTDEMLVEEKHIDLSPEEEMQTWFLINHYLSGHPYVQQQFNLQVMSKSIQLNGSTISTLIRKKYEKSFVEFRNDLRVEYAKNLMEQHLHKTQTLESIGRMSGFASRTTFFNSFKKSTGKNPSQFIEEMDG